MPVPENLYMDSVIITPTLSSNFLSLLSILHFLLAVQSISLHIICSIKTDKKAVCQQIQDFLFVTYTVIYVQHAVKKSHFRLGKCQNGQTK